MTGVALSSLRVTSDFDASPYARGAAQKVAADQAMIAADKARNASLAQADAAMARVVPGMAAVSKSLLDGYGAGAQFESVVRRIGNAVDRGMGLDRANLLLDAAYKKFGLTADAASLAERGFVSIVPAVRELNENLAAYEAQAKRAELVTRAFADAKALIATQAASQQSINSQLGVNTDPAKSARESADAMLAQFGGIDGIAKARAQEAGSAFSAELEARLVAGTAKSARDASNVFDLELKRLETIAQQRAEQAGANYQQHLSQSLGIGGPAATSQGATYSALAEQIAKLDQVEQARAAHNANVAQQNIANAYGINATAKSARDSASAFVEAAQAEEQMAAKAASLRAQVNPLDAEMIKLGKDMAEYRNLLRAGAISQEEYGQAQAMAAKRLSDVDMSMRSAATGGRVLSGELGNLGYQVNDVITGLALGQPIFMIAAQQGGQIYQIFSRSRASVGEFATTFISSVASMVTPVRAGFTVVAASIALATSALFTYQGRMQEVQRQLSGMGRASGASATGIDAIAQANSSPMGLSTNEARELASALAATGKVGVDSLGPIVALGHDFAKTLGVDAKTATDILAQAFADPAKGATELNERLGFLDAQTKILIESLVVQGNRTEAVRILTDRVKGSLASAADVTSFWSRAATAAGNSFSDFLDRVGRGADRIFDGGSGIDEKIGNLTVALLDLQKAKLEADRSPALAFLGGFNAEDNSKAISDITAKLEEYRKQRDLLNNVSSPETKDKQRALEIDGIARAILPTIDATRKLSDETKALNEAYNNPAINKWMSIVGGDLLLALQRAEAGEKALKGSDPIKNQIADTEAQIQALDRRSISQRAQFAREAEARRQSLDPNAGSDVERGQKQDQAARLAAGGQTALDNVRRQSISVLGDLATVDQRVLDKQLELNNLARDGVSVTATQRNAILNIVRAQEEWNRVSGQAAIGIFDLSKANKAAGDEFQTWIDKKYLDPNNPQQYAAAMNYMEKKIRDTADAAAVAGSKLPQLTALMNDAGNLNKQFDTFAVTSVTAVTPALIDMFNGTTTLSNGFKSLGLTIVKALEDAIIKITIIKPLIQGISGLFGGGFTNLDGSITGAVGPTSVGGAPLVNANGNAFAGSNVIPFRNGSAFSNKIFSSPTFFQFRNGGAMANGVMGEAGDEAVMPLRRDRNGRLGVSTVGGSASGGSVGSFGDINIYVNLPEGTRADDASSIAEAIKVAIVPVIDERIAYQSRSRGMLNNAA